MNGFLFISFFGMMQLLIDAVEASGGIYLITADHGNCDDMAQRKKNGEPLLDDCGKVSPLTSHTLAPVSLLLACLNPCNCLNWNWYLLLRIIEVDGVW